MTIQGNFLGSDQKQSKQRTRLCMYRFKMRSFNTRDPDENEKRKQTG